MENQSPQAVPTSSQVPNSNPIQTPPHKKSKLIYAFWGMLALLILTIGASTTVYISKSLKPKAELKTSVIPTPTPKSIPVLKLDTTGWKTFTNTKYNFSFSYPPRFDFQKGPGESITPLKDWETSQYAFIDNYHSPKSLSDSPDKGNTYKFQITANPLTHTNKPFSCTTNEDCNAKMLSDLSIRINKNGTYVMKIIGKDVVGIYDKQNAAEPGYKYRTDLYFMVPSSDNYLLFDLITTSNDFSKDGLSQNSILSQILSTFKFTN